MLSAIDSIVYRLKVAEPHILNLGLFILASSSHLLYCLRVIQYYSVFVRLTQHHLHQELIIPYSQFYLYILYFYIQTAKLFGTIKPNQVHPIFNRQANQNFQQNLILMRLFATYRPALAYVAGTLICNTAVSFNVSNHCQTYHKEFLVLYFNSASSKLLKAPLVPLAGLEPASEA